MARMNQRLPGVADRPGEERAVVGVADAGAVQHCLLLDRRRG